MSDHDDWQRYPLKSILGRVPEGILKVIGVSVFLCLAYAKASVLTENQQLNRNHWFISFAFVLILAFAGIIWAIRKSQGSKR